MTRYLTHANKQTLLDDLARAGFHFDEPQMFEQTTNAQGDSAIWLEHIPLTEAVFDEDGKVVTLAQMSELFHANVTRCEGLEFETEQEKPANPYNAFAE